jgi:hypothetical protein
MQASWPTDPSLHTGEVAGSVMEGGIVVWPNAPAIQIKLVAAHMEAVTAPAIRIRTVVPQRRLSRVLRSAPRVDPWLSRASERVSRGSVALRATGARPSVLSFSFTRTYPHRDGSSCRGTAPAAGAAPPGAAAAGRAFSGALRRFAPVRAAAGDIQQRAPPPSLTHVAHRTCEETRLVTAWLACAGGRMSSFMRYSMEVAAVKAGRLAPPRSPIGLLRMRSPGSQGR